MNVAAILFPLHATLTLDEKTIAIAISVTIDDKCDTVCIMIVDLVLVSIISIIVARIHDSYMFFFGCVCLLFQLTNEHGVICFHRINQKKFVFSFWIIMRNQTKNLEFTYYLLILFASVAKLNQLIR